MPLKFGEPEMYKKALFHLGRGENDFYRLLGQGALKAAKHYGGEDFACVLGQEMAGYATGEVFFTSLALGIRLSHLDAGGYSYDRKHQDKDVEKAVSFLIRDERERVLLTSMVSCLFAREVCKRDVLAECLDSLGYKTLAGTLENVSDRVQKERWKIRVATGFMPSATEIPKRFTQVTTWKGKVDGEYLKALQNGYSRKIMEMGRREQDERSKKEEEKHILCVQCRTVITSPAERIEVQGAHEHTFFKPYGIIFQIGCFRQARGCGYQGPAIQEFSWFPGYSSRIAICSSCLTHLGWLYSAPEKENFHGLILDHLIQPE